METLIELMVFGFIGFTLFGVWRLVQTSKAARSIEDLDDLQSEAGQLQELAATKARVLRDIKELEFDHAMGHLNDNDYKALRKRLERRAIGVIKRLDTARGDHDYDALIDAGLAERFGIVFDDSDDAASGGALAPATTAATASAATPSALPDDGIERAPCGACGWPMDLDASFCSQCGARLTAPDAAATDAPPAAVAAALTQPAAAPAPRVEEVS